MKKLKSFIPVFAVLAVVLCAAIWYMAHGDEESGDPVVNSFEICWDSYGSVEEMAEKSDAVLKGVVLSSEPELRGELVYTRHTIEVTEVHSGKVSGTIEVVQAGGEYKNYLTYAPSGLPLLEEGKEYALFLRKKDSGRKYGEYYEIMGYQGAAEVTGTTYKALDSLNKSFPAQFSEIFESEG